MARSPCEEELGATLSPHVKMPQGNLSAVGNPHLTSCSTFLHITLPQAGVQVDCSRKLSAFQVTTRTAKARVGPSGHHFLHLWTGPYPTCDNCWQMSTRTATVCSLCKQLTFGMTLKSTVCWRSCFRDTSCCF